MNTVAFQDLGRIDYQEAWDYQEKLLKENTTKKFEADRFADPFSIDTQHHLLFCEHPHVYTLGKSGDVSHLLINEEIRNQKGISFHKINRGGDITYHGPGQITGYPIFDLEKFKTDLGWYLRTLEEIMIQLLAEYGLKGERLEERLPSGKIKRETGVWLDVDGLRPRKICALGVRFSRWVSMHGFALNVNTDLKYFSYIVPCGIPDKGVTSLQQELGYEVDMEEVKNKLKAQFAKAFGYAYI